ncbi:MAG: hypothetical protein A3C80_00280 [Candidatus Ryanbacteria bacterium RIFCSPHIGHO2_02_FULL_45_43]|uniref:VIT family protein n=1 Tax=Candidatus Ryanbacteria bacterium RIFCSPHIGHO2_01_45_13 TaxID=1802112 RepID=A0A1G2G0E8_9BACT|nr:MAG: hypothetical protein A2718_01665 [Candidatus Ryanbacteria bacterium RIFCSPHIGHO2_01_FULL_44_130]OGZ43776.1 MAG: hypothetical protein A2W41_04785 [Candidatus Ryanbacteria bacterium RIFCSPHIGHO2_01_45_13]OGZ47718.1 MAG: hypothetical protein A3C80_00280 [Candidatus Ryanbacteria bacterium RIFCSPHIGHO2_02_FULL_45_43]OGZ49614.1 MAG: hypothetical protein A3E55_04280 [Candidatus Ryanbacteria bacterium RIFCSPHIGHO2_12_FULL_44_20]OGZ51296.1 MAG: hypothetical protein A3A17_04605 [Candidatus Ryanba
MDQKTYKLRQHFAPYVRNFIFGVEDSLVSTVGLLSGIAIAGVAQHIILLTGLILIFVEAFSMGVGSLLSEHSAEKYLKGREVSFARALPASAVMFISYFLSGFIPLFPYLVLDVSTAFPTSIAVSLFALFLLGLAGGKFLHVNVLRSSFEMLIIGGVAVIIGAVVRNLVPNLIG